MTQLCQCNNWARHHSAVLRSTHHFIKPSCTAISTVKENCEHNDENLKNIAFQLIINSIYLTIDLMVKLQLNDDSLSQLTRKSQEVFFVVMQIHLEKYLIVG